MLLLPTALHLLLLRAMSKFSDGVSYVMHGDAVTETPETNKKGLFLFGTV